MKLKSDLKEQAGVRGGSNASGTANRPRRHVDHRGPSRHQTSTAHQARAQTRLLPGRIQRLNTHCPEQ
jgi:hypothetical protein